MGAAEPQVATGTPRTAPALRSAWLLLAGSQLLRLIAIAVPWMGWWGWNGARFVPSPLGIGITVAASLLLVPSIARRAYDWIDGRSALGPRAAPATLAVVTAAFVWAFPDRVRFIGDALFREGVVEFGEGAARMLPQSLLLDSTLHVSFARALAGSLHVQVNLVERLIGVFEGAALALAAWWLAGALVRGRAARVLTAVLVTAGGWLVLFTGFGKAPTELCLWTVLFAAAGLHALSSDSPRRSFSIMCVALALALITHRAALVLLVPWAVALAILLRRPGFARSAALPIGVVAIVLGGVAVRIVSIFVSFDLPRHVRPALGGGLGLRMLDLVNLLVVFVPAAPALAALLFVRARGAEPPGRAFVFALALAHAVFAFIVTPQQGVFRDWDVFAAAGVAIAILLAWLLSAAVAGAPEMRHVLMAAAVVTLGSTLVWLIHFKRLDDGMRRVEAFATERPLHSETDRGKALEFLGVRQARAHRPREAVRAYRAAVELVPHRYLYVAWLTSGLEIPDLYEARTAALALTQRFPELPLGWAALAGVSAQLEDAQGYRSSLARMRAMNMTPAERREVRQFLVRYPKVWPDFPLAREDSVRHAQRKL